MSDQIRELLDRLDGDVARAPGADVSSVRGRGDRRRRRHGALVVAGSAAAVVAIAMIPFGLDGFSHSAKVPTASIAPSTPPGPTPSGSQTSEQTVTFLTTGQLPGPATASAWRVVDPQPGSAVARCVDPSTSGASATAEKWFATTANPEPGAEIAVERLLTFESTDQASAAMTAFVAKARACAYDSDEPLLSHPAGAQATTLYYRYDDGVQGAASMQSLVVVQVGNRLAVLTVADDGNGDITYIDDLQQTMPGQLADQLAG